jgi:hypothetical protein
MALEVQGITGNVLVQTYERFGKRKQHATPCASQGRGVQRDPFSVMHFDCQRRAGMWTHVILILELLLYTHVQYRLT